MLADPQGRDPLAAEARKGGIDRKASGVVRYTNSLSLPDYGVLARSVGLDPEQLLDSVDLPRSCLEDPTLHISAAAFAELLERSATISGLEDFGLRLAERRTPSPNSPLGLMVRGQPNLRKSLEANAKFLHLITDAVVFRLEERDEVAIVTMGARLGCRLPLRQGIEFCIGVLVRVLGARLGYAWRPEAVCFAHSSPSDLETHHRLFGRSVQFEHDFDGLVVKRSDLDRPLATADPMIAGDMARLAARVGEPGDSASLERVRERVRALLPTGACSIERVAEELGVDRRTVRRRLSAQGWTFRDLRQELRCEAAAHYLTSGRRSSADAAGLLGFTDTSTLTRWFRASFGCTPTEWRRRYGASTSLSGDRGPEARTDTQTLEPDLAVGRQIECYVGHLGKRPRIISPVQVREEIVALLLSGECTAWRVARRLGVDRTTLHRRLSAEGQTFSQLIEEVRREYAMHYLAKGERSMEDTAKLLGFSAQSAFTRWFRSSFGCPPSRWRRNLRRDAAE